jgi:hypothetical protein
VCGIIKLSEQTRADFQPQIEKPTELKTWFRWDGQPYFGECTIDGKRCFWIWCDSLNEEIGEWERLRYQVNGVWWQTVEREIKGCTVYCAHVMTKLQCDNIDLYNKIWNENRNDRPKFEEALKAVGLPDMIVKIIDDRHALPIVGYWFLEGAEHSEENMFYGPESKLEKLEDAERYFIESLPIQS